VSSDMVRHQNAEQAAVGLSDVLDFRLSVVFCGLNPALTAVDIGFRWSESRVSHSQFVSGSMMRNYLGQIDLAHCVATRSHHSFRTLSLSARLQESRRSALPHATGQSCS
jgi:hypothetical protein